MEDQFKAQASVSKAIGLGQLKRLDGSILCVDCGKPAAHYDHRDYKRPLEVEPVCRSCNRKRGPAIGFIPGRVLNIRNFPKELMIALNVEAAKRSIRLRELVIERLSESLKGGG